MLLQRARVARRRRDRDGAAGERRRALAPHQRQQLEGVLEQLVAAGDGREVPAVQLVLAPEPRRAEPAERPPARQHVERGVIFARWAMLRYVMPLTSAPSRTVVVAAARNPSVVVLSGMSSHSRPTDGICTTWSITEIDEKPTSSAARAMAPRRGASSARAAGPVEAADLQAEAQRHRDPPPGAGRRPARRRASGARPRRRRRTTRWTPSKPSSSRASTAAANERSWLVTTLDGTASGRPRLRARASRSGVSTTTTWHGTPAAAARRAVAGAHAGLEGGRVDDGRAARGAGAWRRSARGPPWRPSSPAGRGGAGRRPRAGRPSTRSPPAGTSGAPTSTCRRRRRRRARRGSGRAAGSPRPHVAPACGHPSPSHCDTPSSCSSP